ncbi:RNA polymerase sigma factor [Sporosarcina sp. FA9]|uniref:RNA polymerase sigma factor n=1 Tax=Sporosarcina sp. FA9 TaxID=3413030 RepID=UPI003F65D330
MKDFEFDALYRTESDRVYRYIYMLVGHEQKAEDLTHDAFLKAYRNIHSFRNESSHSTWLIKIARNVTYDYFRRKKIVSFLAFGKDEYIDENNEDPANISVNQEEIKKMHQAINTLKQNYQDVLILRNINENTIKETAFILGWTEAKVKGMSKRAMDALKGEMLKREGEQNAWN